MLKAGLYGFGGIAKIHKKAYEILAADGVPVELTSACDVTPERFAEDTKINISIESTVESTMIRPYPCIEDMLENEDLDIIDICLPTYLHADAVIDMLEKGYNVLSEKPMALSTSDCRRMIAAAKQSKGKLMIGQCLRFRQDVTYVKELIDKGTYGNVISACFQRLGSPPLWSWNNWFIDPDKSGGAILDLHIHDVDLVRFLFGEPAYVSCLSKHVHGRYDSNNTRFIYNDDKIVVAMGDWSLTGGFSFYQDYRIAFEGATLVYSCNPDTLTLYAGDGEPVPAPIVITDPIQNEINYFVEMIKNDAENTINKPEDSANTIALIEKIRESADNKGKQVKT